MAALIASIVLTLGMRISGELVQRRLSWFNVDDA